MSDDIKSFISTLKVFVEVHSDKFSSSKERLSVKERIESQLRILLEKASTR